MTMLPAPAGCAIVLVYEDGTVEFVPDQPTTDALVSFCLRAIDEGEAEHGPISSISPVSDRGLQFVSPARAAELHAMGVSTIDTRGMSFAEVIEAAERGRA